MTATAIPKTRNSAASCPAKGGSPNSVCTRPRPDQELHSRGQVEDSAVRGKPGFGRQGRRSGGQVGPKSHASSRMNRCSSDYRGASFSRPRSARQKEPPTTTRPRSRNRQDRDGPASDDRTRTGANNSSGASDSYIATPTIGTAMPLGSSPNASRASGVVRGEATRRTVSRLTARQATVNPVFRSAAG